MPIAAIMTPGKPKRNSGGLDEIREAIVINKPTATNTNPSSVIWPFCDVAFGPVTVVGLNSSPMAPLGQ